MTSPALPIARNTALLSAALATHSAMLALGFNDLLSSAAGAGLTLLGGLVLTTGGAAALATGALALLAAPAVWILRDGAAHAAASRRRS